MRCETTSPGIYLAEKQMFSPVSFEWDENTSEAQTGASTLLGQHTGPFVFRSYAANCANRSTTSLSNSWPEKNVCLCPPRER